MVVRFSSAHGPVLVEVKDDRSQGPVAVGRADSVVESAHETFERALDGLRPIAEGILDQVVGIVHQPETVEVTFGIRLSGTLGVVLAQSSVDAHCTIKLSWRTADQNTKVAL
jgi:hypothetical protein